MKWRFVILGVSVAAMLCVLALAPAARSLGGRPIPFVGMSMTYYANRGGDFVSRPVVVLSYDAQSNTVLIRDGTDWLRVNVATREITWSTSSLYKVGDAVEYWIPTNVRVGSLVKIISDQARVVGSATLSVQGRNVLCWQLYIAWTDSSGKIVAEDTWYYEMTKGLWIAASFVQYDSNGLPTFNWGGHLASTNVPF